MVVVTSAAKRAMLLYLLPQLRGLQVRLFANNRTPTPSDTTADYTEVFFPNYTPYSLASLGLPYYTPDVPPRAEVASPVLSFVADRAPAAPCPIYGYMVWDFIGPNLWWAELDPAGPTWIRAAGDRYDLALRLDLANLT